MSWCRAPIWSPWPDFCFLLDNLQVSCWEDGSVIYSYNCFWALPEQSLLGPGSADLTTTFYNLIWPGVELSLFYGRGSVDQFVLVSGSPLGPMTRFYPYLFFSDNCFVVLPLWRVCNLQCNHWGPITIHYRLIWDCVPSLSPLTTRRDCGGGILTRLHTRKSEIFLLYHI
jgi:hypothetical protein